MIPLGIDHLVLLTALATQGSPVPTRVREISSDGYRVTVDFRVTVGPTRELNGANKGPLQFSGTCATPPAPPFAHTYLYQRAGIASVRLHDDAFDLSLVYQDAERFIQFPSQSDCVAQCLSACSCSGMCTSNGRCPTTVSCYAVPFFSSYLVWNPATGSLLNDPANYVFAEPDQQYREIIGAGMEPYLRLGESYNGPAWTDDPSTWKVVARNVAGHYLDDFAVASGGFGVSPPFIEIYNEPDGGFWAGTAQQFAPLYQQTHDYLAATLPAAGLPSLGGCGFTDGNLASGMPSIGPFASNVLRGAGEDRFDFVSVHYYGEGMDTPPSDPAGELLCARATLDTICSAEGWSRCPPLHVSEWNMGLDSLHGFELFSSPRIGSFVSLMLTLMQDPFLDVERAHYYAGCNHSMGMVFHRSATASINIRPSALAMSMHQGLRSELADTRIEEFPRRLSKRTARAPAPTALEAALADVEVSALGTTDATGHTVVLTNHGRRAREVQVVLRGLLGATATLTTMDALPPGGVDVDTEQIGGFLRPVSEEVDAVFGAYITSTTRSLRVHPGSWARLDLRLEPWAVTRIEIDAGS